MTRSSRSYGHLAAGFLLLLASHPVCLSAEETRVTFHAREFGAVPDVPGDCGPAIRAAIEAALASGRPAEVVFEAGTYQVATAGKRNCCFSVAEAENFVMRGSGKETTIVVTNPMVGVFSFVSSQQVSLRDLTIDYDPVPFCQGTIRAVDVEAGHFDLDVAAGFTTPDADNFVNAHEPYGKWGMIIDPSTRRIRAGTPDHYMTPRWEHQSDRVWRFFTTQEHYRRNLQHMRVGDAYVHLARGYGSAVGFHGCVGVRLENVTVHASPGLAVGLVANQGEVLVHGLEVRFPENTKRLLTTNADGVHCQQNRSGPIIEKCYFEGMADDAINIYAPPNVLLEVRAPTEWLVSPGCLVQPGDHLQVLDPQTAAVRGQVQALDVKVDGRAFLLTLDQPLEGAVAGADHRSADTLYNLDACGAGFQIRHNHMNGNRRYGCLLRAGGGIVEDNRFEDTTGGGVVCTNEPDWPEGPMPWGITIRNNVFLRGGTCLGYADAARGAALKVQATRLGHRVATTEAIHGVTIEANEFIDQAGSAIFVGGARDVTLRDNRVAADAQAESRRTGGSLIIERSLQIRVMDHQVSDPRAGTTAAVEILASTLPGEASVQIDGLRAEMAPEAQPVIDHRGPHEDGRDILQ